MVEEVKMTKRKQGFVKGIYVELLIHQKDMLDDYSDKLAMTKSDIIAQALNMWFGSVKNDK